jgi:hypothetical protein
LDDCDYARNAAQGIHDCIAKGGRIFSDKQNMNFAPGAGGDLVKLCDENVRCSAAEAAKRLAACQTQTQPIKNSILRNKKQREHLAQLSVSH